MGAEGVWSRVNADSRGYADIFKCSNCGSYVHLGTFEKECDYPYCPWCRAEMVDSIEESDGK